MADLFLSYSRSDRARAKSLAEALAQHGWSVWWDREVPLGKSFDEVIEQNLDAAKCVIVLWSHDSVASNWVKVEASEGARRGVLIPVWLDPTPKVPLEFRLMQAANLADWQPNLPHAEFQRLLEHIARLLGKPSAGVTERSNRPSEESVAKARNAPDRRADRDAIPDRRGQDRREPERSDADRAASHSSPQVSARMRLAVSAWQERARRAAHASLRLAAVLGVSVALIAGISFIIRPHTSTTQLTPGPAPESNLSQNAPNTTPAVTIADQVSSDLQGRSSNSAPRQALSHSKAVRTPVPPRTTGASAGASAPPYPASYSYSAASGQGTLGLMLEPSPLGLGALVSNVKGNGPGDLAGVRIGDVITGFNGNRVSSPQDLVTLVRNTAPGQRALMLVIRAGHSAVLTVVVGDVNEELVDERKQQQETLRSIQDKYNESAQQIIQSMGR